MKQRILFYFLALTLMYSCAKKADDFADTEEPEFNIDLVSFEQNKVIFSYTLDSTIENTKIIWNNVNALDLDNKIGELSADPSTNEIEVPNLEAGETYFFRFVGEFNSDTIYSEIVEVTLLEQIFATEYNQILSSVSNAHIVREILKLDDGYLFFTGSAIVSVSRTDNDFNVLWSFDINDWNKDLEYVGVYKLNGSNEYLMFLGGFGGSNEDPWGNTFSPDSKVHYVKFNIDGNVIWHRENSTNIVDNIWVDHRDYPRSFSKYSINNKLIVASDSTYYTDNDSYYRELNFDDEGEIISNEIIDEGFAPQTVLFKENNKLISYGTRDLTPNDGLNAKDIIIQNFNNNQLTQYYSYGNNGAEDYLSSILDEDANIVIVGTNGHENESDGESRWIFNINAINGEIIWDIRETEENYSYRGKDVTLDTDGNYLSLFFDMYNLEGLPFNPSHEYNYATLIKSDNEGNIIWKFVDGEENNSDYFEPQRVFQEGNEYLIIGNKNYANDGLWVKRISLE